MQMREGRTVLVTGGAGFIGSNLVARLLSEREVEVRIFDNLSRAGVEHNLEWLRSIDTDGRLEVIRGDVRNFDEVLQAVEGATEIYHLAAQVAVTTSVEDPRTDFEINAGGTLHVLEAARRSKRRPMVLFTSTNKVYGGLETVQVEADGTRYRAVDPAFCGVSETMPLDFHSPYGCSKGAADQYVRDYARIYDLPTVVFRMSCICGPRQFGNEDQGWVAHFLYSILARQPLNIYGDGLQVRDVLHVHDLLDAMGAVRSRLGSVSGRVYNVGGGMERSLSVMEMVQAIESQTGERCEYEYSAMRPGDQPLYISDYTRLSEDTGWKPKRSVDQTLADIHRFWEENRVVIERRTGAAAGAVVQAGATIRGLATEQEVA